VINLPLPDHDGEEKIGPGDVRFDLAALTLGSPSPTILLLDLAEVLHERGLLREIMEEISERQKRPRELWIAGGLKVPAKKERTK
jgi:hypothetical protein